MDKTAFQGFITPLGRPPPSARITAATQRTGFGEQNNSKAVVGQGAWGSNLATKTAISKLGDYVKNINVKHMQKWM